MALLEGLGERRPVRVLEGQGVGEGWGASEDDTLALPLVGGERLGDREMEGEAVGEREEITLRLGVEERRLVRVVEAQALSVPVAHPEAEWLGVEVVVGVRPPLRDWVGLRDREGDPLEERDRLGEGLVDRVREAQEDTVPVPHWLPPNPA